MATRIYVDQENGGVATNLAPKTRTRLHSAPCLSSKTLAERPFQHLAPGSEVFSPITPMTGPKRKGLGSVRKALGSINSQTNTNRTRTEKKLSAISEKSGQALKMLTPAEMVPETETTVPTKNLEYYPEIENCNPYDPLDFESFDILEEHRISHLCLAGVPLQMEVRFDRPANKMDSPIKFSPMKFTYPICQPDLLDDLLDVEMYSFLQMLDTVIDLPPMECGSPL